MKILVCLIAVLAITAPVLATTVTIVGDTSVPGTLTLKYYVTPDTDALRGIALTLSCDGEVTTNAAGTTPGAEWNVCIDHAYQVIFDGGTYALDEPGSTPLAKTDGPGVPDTDVSDFSICLGMVDEGGTQQGVAQGSSIDLQDLCTIVLSDNSYTVTATGDTLRGEAVGSPVTIVFDANNDGTPGDNVFEGEGVCFSGTPEQEAEWDDWGQPQNWCGDCWAQGDINGDCLITFSGDVMTAFTDLKDPTSAEALTGRSDFNMDGLITFSGDVMPIFTNLKNGVTCPEPCIPLE